MKGFYALLIVVTTGGMFAGCKKDPAVYADFTKITVTDSDCIFIGDVDPADWTYDDSWNTQETTFLNYKDSLPKGDSTIGYIQVSAICPNPNAGAFSLNVNTGNVCRMHLVCVNNEFQILYYTSRYFTGGPNELSFDFGALTSFHKNENYRIYYGFYTAKDSLYYKGHGDFRIE